MQVIECQIICLWHCE